MDRTEITELLQKHTSGNREVIDELIPVVYEKLQQMARHRLSNERKNHTLSTTALVHEAYIKLVDFDQINWQNRDHFFGIASQIMRNILVDYAVEQNAQKRGGKQCRVTLGDRHAISEVNIEDILAIHQALDHLKKFDERQVRVVECRFFGGLTINETSDALNISVPTVCRDWKMAKAWLNREINNQCEMREVHEV